MRGKPLVKELDTMTTSSKKPLCYTAIQWQTFPSV